MYNIQLLTIGTLKQGSLKDMAEALMKRLSPYAKMEIKSLKEEPFHTKNEASRIQSAEAGRIRQNLNRESFKILLTERGEEMDSETFSKKLRVWSENESRPIQIVIGGPLGLDPTLAKDVDYQLALSRMTFPHELAQVMLLEQLYRAITIQKGKTYHY